MRAWRGIWVMAAATTVQVVRSRLLWLGGPFALALLGLAVAAASVALFERSRLIVDVGLAAASALGGLMAAATSLTLVHRDLQGRDAYPLLVRPLPRGAYLLGRFLGLWLTMAAAVGLMGAATAGVVVLFGDPVPAAFAAALWLSACELAVVVALTLLAALLAAPALAAAGVGAAWLAGHLAQDVAAWAERSAGLQAALLRTTALVLPDLARLSLRGEAANDLPVPAGVLSLGTLYALAYAGTLLALAALAFDRRRSL